MLFTLFTTNTEEIDFSIPLELETGKAHVLLSRQFEMNWSEGPIKGAYNHPPFPSTLS